jgi:hypothetical protein
LSPDPDPVCLAGYLSGSRVLMTKNWKKFRAGKKFDIFLIKNLNLHILGLHIGSPSYRRSLQSLKREHPALQNMKVLNFFKIL